MGRRIDNVHFAWGRTSCFRATPSSQTQQQDQPPDGRGSHAHGNGRTTAGKPRGRTCGTDTRGQRATGDIHGLRVHPQANLRLPSLAGRRTHQYREQVADTDCMINSTGRVNDGHQLCGGEGSHLPLQLQDGAEPQAHLTTTGIYILKAEPWET